MADSILLGRDRRDRSRRVDDRFEPRLTGDRLRLSRSSRSAPSAGSPSGAITDQPALLWTNVVLLVLDLFGIWRWLGRQVRVEEGARSAAGSQRAHAR